MSNARELAELGGAYSTGGYPHFKNRIINGDMRIDQRNAGASVSATNGGLCLDRYKMGSYDGSAQTGKFTVQQNAGSVTPPSGFTKYLGVTSSAATSLGSSAEYYVAQFIEGLNIADLDWGLSTAKAVTLSFWVRSSLTGTFGGSLMNSASTVSYPFSYSIALANTWTPIIISVPGPTSGTWGTDTGVGIRVIFSLGMGSTLSGTANTWASARYQSATGATSVVGTNGATFYITGVQLEKGSTATSFDYRPYGTELALCQRYYVGGFSMWTNTSSIPSNFSLPVSMRATPTFTGGGAGWAAGFTSSTHAGYAFQNTSGNVTLTASSEL